MEQKKEFIINTIFIAVLFILAYLVINYVLPILLPFIVGFLFAYITIKICRKWLSDTKLNRSIVLSLLFILIAVIASILVALGINKTIDFISSLPTFYTKTIAPSINSFEKVLANLNKSLPDSINTTLNDIIGGLSDSIKTLFATLATSLVDITTGLLTDMPEMIVSIIVAIISAYYIVLDYEEIARWLTVDFLGKRGLKIFYDIKDFCEGTLFKIILSYILIMFITFIELLMGLSILKINNSGALAFLISILDILPILGVGTVLIPWGIVLIVLKNTWLGIGILILYLIITVIRNIIEPKIVGGNLGLHPLAMLVSMIVGLDLFGIIGMFCLPLLLSFFKEKKNKIEQ